MPLILVGNPSFFSWMLPAGVFHPGHNYRATRGRRQNENGFLRRAAHFNMK
jgi:hypothetical protein